MDLNGTAIFTWPIDWNEPVNGQWSFDLRELQLGFGPELTDIQQDHVLHGFKFTVDLRDDDIDDVRDFLDALQGRANLFWLPGPAAAFVVEDGSSASAFKITEQGAATGWNLHPGGYLYFTKSGETAQTGKIESVTDNGDGTETVTLESALSTAVDETWEAFPLYLVRLADDTERVEICAERYIRRSFVVVEVPTEYDAVAEPEQPVFLYRFVAPFPTGDVVWRFTSHPEDVTIEAIKTQSSSSSSSSTADDLSSGSESSLSSSSSDAGDETWLAVPIEHSRLNRSAKMGGTVDLSADYDSVEPLRLMLPMRLTVRLRLEILRTNTRFEEPQVIFTGTVRKPALRGRRITVKCAEWGDAIEGKVPNFFVQRTCNYRVYEAETCKVNRSTFERSVTITAADGRTVMVDNVGLTGTSANRYAGGWIEHGTGINRRVLYILSSSAAVGSVITLTVSVPFTGETPVSATMVPGCDGNRSTCEDKFDNLVNFGGHETPKDNLTLVAIRTDEVTGGKK